MQVCRVCLGTEMRMYRMSEHGLRAMYARVVGVQISAEDKLPRQLCRKCAVSLSSANNFIKKALKTQRLLLLKMNNSVEITTSDIESIDKAQHEFESTLQKKFKTANQYDFPFIGETVDTNDSCNNETSQSSNSNFNEDISETVSNIKKEEPMVFIEVFTENIIKTEPVEFNEEQITEVHQKESHDYYTNVNKGAGIDPEEGETDNENDNITYDEHVGSIKTENTSDESLGELPQMRRKPVEKSTKEDEAVKSPIHTSYDCSYCSFKTNRKGHLGQHINSVHTKSSYFKCSYCPYMAYQRCHLRQHVNSRHTKSTSYDCSHCVYKAYQKSSLTRHIKSQHPKISS